MLVAADAVLSFTAGKSLADFLGDEMMRSAVYYNFTIIGEALTQIRKTHPEVAEQVPEHERVIAFRNQFIHGYDRLNDEITWRIVEQKLPVLRADVQRLLDT